MPTADHACVTAVKPQSMGTIILAALQLTDMAGKLRG